MSRLLSYQVHHVEKKMLKDFTENLILLKDYVTTPCGCENPLNCAAEQGKKNVSISKETPHHKNSQWLK